MVVTTQAHGSGPARGRRVLVVGVCALALVVGFLSYFAVQRLRTKSGWREQIASFHKQYGLPIERIGPEAHALQSLVWEDILRRAEWGTAEVDRLWEIYDPLDRTPPDDPVAADRWKHDNTVRASAFGAIGVRLEYDAPIKPEARERIVQLLVEDLHHTVAFRRRSAAVLLIDYRFIEDRSVRLAVERLLDDPDNDTRESIAFNLADYNDRKARWMALQERKIKAKGAP